MSVAETRGLPVCVLDGKIPHMKTAIRTSLLSALLAAAIAIPAVALASEGPEGGPSQNKRDFGRSHAPEFDVAAAGAIAAVIAGGGIVLARRRRRS